MDVIDFEKAKEQNHSNAPKYEGELITINEWLRRYPFSWSEFCAMRDVGIGPRIEIHRSQDLIFVADAEEWMRRHETMDNHMGWVWHEYLAIRREALAQKWQCYLKHSDKHDFLKETE